MLKTELDAGILTLTLDRPDKRNALSSALIEALLEALRLGALFQALRLLPKPVVAVVQGRALAGGCGLATACDLVLAADDAQLGYPEIQRGFVPAMVMAMLVRQVGEKRALELTVTGRLLSAAEARSFGLVTEVISTSDFAQRTSHVIQQLAGVSLTAYALTKQLCYAQDGLPFDDAIKLGARINAMSRATPDFKTAIAAFLRQ